MDEALRNVRDFMRGPPPSDNPYDSELTLGRPSLLKRAGQIRPVRSMRSFAQARRSSETLNGSISSIERPNLRERASQGIIRPLGELLQRPFSRGPHDNPTPPPSRSENDPLPDDGQFPQPSFLRRDMETTRLDTRDEWRKTPKDNVQIGVRRKDSIVQQRVEESAVLAQFTPAYYDAWVHYLQCLSMGCFNISRLPEEPLMSETFTFLPALFPHDELNRQSVADALCSMIHSTAQRVEAERVLELTRTAFDSEAYTVSTFDELTEHWHFSSGIQQWPSGEKERSKSLAAHALLSMEILVVLDTELDWRFQNHPLASDGPKMRFFVAAPMLAPSGEVIAVVTFYSRFPREKFDLKSIRTLRQCSESLTNTLWLQDEKEEPEHTPEGPEEFPEVTNTQLPSRPFSGSDLTSVQHNPGHCTPERGVSPKPTQVLDSRKLRSKLDIQARDTTKRFENAPDSPTLGKISPIFHSPPASPIVDHLDLTDVGNFQSAHARSPNRLRVRTYPFPPIIPSVKASLLCGYDLEHTLRLCKDALGFETLYIVALEPIMPGLPDADLEAGAMTMRIIASTGLGRDKELSVSMHLRALRTQRDVLLLDNQVEQYFARGFAVSVLQNPEERPEKATEGVVFGGFRRFWSGTYNIFDFDSMGFTHEQFRRLHSVRNIIVRTLKVEDQYIDGRPDHTYEDSPWPSSSSPMPHQRPSSPPLPSPSRYLANEAQEVEVPEPHYEVQHSSSAPYPRPRVRSSIRVRHRTGRSSHSVAAQSPLAHFNSVQEGSPSFTTCPPKESSSDYEPRSSSSANGSTENSHSSPYAHLSPVGARALPFSRQTSPRVPQHTQKSRVSPQVPDHPEESQSLDSVEMPISPAVHNSTLKGLNIHGLRREERSVRPPPLVANSSPLGSDSSPEAHSSDSEY